MRPYKRNVRLAEYIQQELAQQILTRSKDPRFSEVTVTHVDLSPDLKNAKVFVTVFRKELAEELLFILNKSAGFFQSTLAKSAHFRSIPRITFVYDTQLETAQKITDLINKI
jgi:ribosome-binding factor A